MLPHIHIPAWHITDLPLLGPLTIEPFGVLVALALLLGYWLGRRRARNVGLDPDLCADAMWWAIVSGFVGAHLVSVLFYFPEQVAQNPLVLLYFWQGISSFGGIVGGTLGAYVFLRRWGASMRAYADAIVFGFVPGWILGRLGCTVVFDHPGLPTDFVLGMADSRGIVRHNLGLYEMLFALVLTVLLYVLRNKRPFVGFYCALLLLLYSPVRFMLDFLRVQRTGPNAPGDQRYLGLTPGQYLAVATFAFGLWLVWSGLRERGKARSASDDACAIEGAAASGGFETRDESG